MIVVSKREENEVPTREGTFLFAAFKRRVVKGEKWGLRSGVWLKAIWLKCIFRWKVFDAFEET